GHVLDLASFPTRRSSDLRQRQVDGHLVAIEVGVEAFANQRMDAYRVAFDQHRLECLYAHAVQRRRAVEQHGVVLDDLLQNIPNLDRKSTRLNSSHVAISY